MTAQSDPSRKAFEKFLFWLSPDPELALKKHGEIMQRINSYFIRRGCREAEELSGETRDRVIKIINDGGEYPKADALFFSVATKVWQEYTRKPRPEPLPKDDLLTASQEETEKKELRAHCLEQCLTQLPESERDLIMRYYQSRGHKNSEARQQLMAEHGKDNTLRVKALRIRTKLRICIDLCMDETVKW